MQIEALRRFPFDTVLCAVSALDHFIYSFAEEFLPFAAARGVGVVGMKIFAYRKLAHVADRALRYALALPLTTVIVGIATMAQLEADLAVAENFTPMTGPERLDVLPRDSAVWCSRRTCRGSARTGASRSSGSRATSRAD